MPVNVKLEKAQLKKKTKKNSMFIKRIKCKIKLCLDYEIIN